MSDDPHFESMLAKLPQATASDVRWSWDEDDFVPVSREEFNRGLRETVALAREQGWIPKEDPGCECFTCSAWRRTGL